MARGRTRFNASSIFPRLFYFYATISFVLCDYGVPIEIKLWDTGRTPLAHMVDVTNEFGLKVIAEHNFLNDNNIAFSPYGLMGILVALYEGVDGESSYQIQRGMQLPWNRNVMRIGFRDIHRTLKTYFVPEEGFLAGLALNNENVTFNESYKKILRFYGFDLETDQISTPMPAINDPVSITTSTEPGPNATSTDSEPTSIITTERVTGRDEPSTISTKEETTAYPDAEIITNTDAIDKTTPTDSSAASNAESTTPIVPEKTSSPPTTDLPVEATASVTPTIPIVSTSTSTSTETTTVMTTAVTTEITTLESSPTSSTLTSESIALTENDTTLSTKEMTSTSLTDSSSPEMTSTSLTDSSTPVIPSTSLSDSTTLEITERSTTMTTLQTTDTEGTSMISDSSQTDMSTTEEISDSTTASTLETLERRKRSHADYILTKPPVIDDYLYYRSFDIPPEIGNTQSNTDKMFLVNGLRNVQVSYMQYDTVLEHAYLPHLEASALRLPLDSDRYYLLVVLPSRGGAAELGRLLARMARESDLSDVHAALRPRRVRAIVPSFTVKGHVTLTTDLQKLGIRDVFEPRQHDFTPMTRQPGVYVRSIEQAVSVAIRKYQPDDQKKDRYVTNRNRVYFAATYPFLYFVMDSSIHVALMAGKMVDPLNTRIL